MRVIAIPILCLVACLISSIKGEIYNGHDETVENSIDKNAIDKTVDLINKRAYYYATSGPGKRLPNYDFGLGKRAGGPYSFGLGKRNDEGSLEEYESYDSFPIGYFLEEARQENFKRARPYSFGLGKREGKEERRSSNSRYNFGLGRR